MRSNKESRKTGTSAYRDSCFSAFLILCVIESVEGNFRNVISGLILRNVARINSLILVTRSASKGERDSR